MFKKIIAILMVSVLTAGCASLPDDQSVLSRAQQSSVSKTSSSTILQRAKLKLSKAASEELALYGPSYLEKANESYKKAQELYKNKQDEQSIKLHAGMSIEYVNAGLRNKRVVQDALTKSLDNRRILLDLSAPKIDQKGFQNIHLALIELVRLIEQRQLDKAIHQEPEVLEKMRTLEVRVIGQKYLRDCIQHLNAAEQNHAQTLLPDTQKQAINELTDTRQFIRQNPRQALKIQQLADTCTFNAQRLKSLTDEANRLKNMMDTQIERYILIQEERLQRIGKQLGHKDIRNLSFDDQSRTLGRQAEESADLLAAAESDNAKLSPAQFEKWKRKTVLLQAEVRRLQKIIKRLEN